MLNCMFVCRQNSHFCTTSNTKIPIRVFCFMLPIFGNERSVINSYLQCLRPGTRTTWGVHPVCVDWLQQTCSLIVRQQEGGAAALTFPPSTSAHCFSVRSHPQLISDDFTRCHWGWTCSAVFLPCSQRNIYHRRWHDIHFGKMKASFNESIHQSVKSYNKSNLHNVQFL